MPNATTVAILAAIAAAAVLHRRRRRLALRRELIDATERASGPQQLHKWEEQSYVHCATPAEELKRRLPSPTVADIEMRADQLDLARAKRIYDEHGVLVVRGLNLKYVDEIRGHADDLFAQAVTMLEAGHAEPVVNEIDGARQHLGWATPNGTLFIPAPPGHVRDKQVMVLGLDYYTAASMLRAATDERALDVVGALLGTADIELFGKGQCFYKEGIANATGSAPGGLRPDMYSATTLEVGVAADTGAGRPGGNPKYLHQDSAYFMFAKQGACATLNYSTATNRTLDNGPLYVVPGSHRWGHLPHVDTPSHLGVPAREWSFADGLCVEGEAGDAIFFHIHTLHGSTPNRSSAPRATFINRYITPDDYQAFFATDVLMRAKARREYEAAVGRGALPHKERNLLVRGRRAWSADAVQTKIDARVNH